MVKKCVLMVLGLMVLLLTACGLSHAAADVPSTDLTRYQVVNSKGDAVARVEDILVAADSGQISYVVVVLPRDPFSYGKAAFIDAAVPRTAVPWDFFSIDSASKHLQLKVDSSFLYAAPLLREKPDRLETNWDAAIHAYWQAYSISKK